jgi:hypothetical protein
MSGFELLGAAVVRQAAPPPDCSGSTGAIGSHAVRGRTGESARADRVALASALVLAALFRLPPLLDAGAMNSDAAVVGLQAMHFLNGEWSWVLWGAAYQAPADSAAATIPFALLGPTPLALALVPFAGQLLDVALYFDVFRRKLRALPAVLLTLPIVFTPMAVNLTLLYIQRQACFTLAAVAVWLLATAQTSKRPALRLALGSWAAIYTLYFDFYSIQWLGPMVLFAFGCTWRSPMRASAWARRAGAVATGLIAGWLTVRWFRSHCPASPGQLAASMDHVKHNFELLKEQALPWTLSYKIFAHQGTLYADLFVVPKWFHDVQIVGAVLVVVAMVAGASSFFVRRIPWLLRSLALFGAATMCASLAGFLISGMPADQWSTRYLAPLILMMPFALAPIAYVLRPRHFALLCAPYLVSAAVNGWVSYGINFVHHGLPVRSARGTAREELEVGKLLRDHHIAYATAQYWLAYRLTFLFRENPIVVPLSPGEDRYPAYRVGFNAARDVAYVFHPSEPRADPSGTEWRLRSAHADYERFKVADFTVFIEHRH